MPDSFRVSSPRRSQGEVVLVADLLDLELRSWNVAKVRRFFLPNEAEVVLSIPISPRMLEDSVIWAWTTNGLFTVKSAYGVAQKWLREFRNRPEIGCCSDNSKMRAIWKVIWQLKCPSKIRQFMWRACKNILPTKNWL